MNKYGITKSDPEDKEFFTFFWSAVKHLPFVQFMAQCISCLCSGVTVYYLIFQKIAPYVLTSIAVGIALFVAIVAAIFVEKLIAGSLPPVIRQISRYGLRFKNFQYGLMFLVLLPFAGGALGFNYMLNSIASDEIGEVAAGTVETTDLLALKLASDKKSQLVMDAFEVDKADFVTNWKDKRQSIVDQYDADIETQRLKIKTNEKKAANGHKWAQGHADNARDKIPKLKKEKAAKLEQWTKDRSNALKELEDKRDLKLAAKDTSNNQTLLIAQKSNQSKEDKLKVKQGRYSSIAAMFGLGSVYVTFLCICLIEVFEAGSKIKVEFVTYETPILQAIWEGISGQIGEYLRNKIPTPIPPKLATNMVKKAANLGQQKNKPIGFGRDAENSIKTPHSELKPQQVIGGHKTVKHGTKEVSFEKINLNIKTYEKRLSDAKTNVVKFEDKGLLKKKIQSQNAVKNNGRQLQYWQGKKQEWLQNYGSL